LFVGTKKKWMTVYTYLSPGEEKGEEEGGGLQWGQWLGPQKYKSQHSSFFLFSLSLSLTLSLSRSIRREESLSLIQRLLWLTSPRARPALGNIGVPVAPVGRAVVDFEQVGGVDGEARNDARGPVTAEQAFVQ